MLHETVSHYKIITEIGRGGMGVVYLAEDTNLHCKRALKFLPPSVTPDSPDHIRLVNEARALAALEHHNICPVQEIGEHDGQTFIVMSYLEGQTLKERMAEGPIPLSEALEISRQISEGLAAAHAKGIVHRDVKPDNVMLIGADGEKDGPVHAVLMDFGIAKNQENTLMTRTGTVMGTAAYMSPEQARGEEVDAASDVWAVGVMLFEMLGGTRPFKGDIEPALLYAIVNMDPEPLVGQDSEVPKPVQRVIGKALAKQGGDRYADARELLIELGRATAGEAVTGRSLQTTRRKPIIGATASAVALILVALFVWPGFLAPTDAISTLAVMPLENRSEEDGQTFLSEGVADELAISLNKVGALTIISRSSAARARELYSTNREIGAGLGVEALIEGSVQRDGDKVRVSIHLVATEDDRLLWSESYSRDMKDILNLQSEIALAISSALKTKLTLKEKETLTKEREIDPEAFEELLLGRHFMTLATAEGCEKAIEHFKNALAIEPEYAQAHIGLAGGYYLHRQMADLPVSEMVELVKYHSNAAIEADPESAIAYDEMAGNVQAFDWDLPTAGIYYARARELDPKMGMMGYAQYLNIIGRHDDALHEALIAGREDPLNPFIQANVAARYLYAGQDEKAMELLDRIQEWEPDFWISLWVRGLMQIFQGKPSEAVKSLQLSVVQSGNSPAVKPNLANALILAGRREEATKILQELEKQAEEEYLSPFYLGMLYAGFGRSDDAFAAFDRAVEERDYLMFWIDGLFSPETRNLQSDPRWPELLERIGLPNE